MQLTALVLSTEYNKSNTRTLYIKKQIHVNTKQTVLSNTMSVRKVRTQLFPLKIRPTSLNTRGREGDGGQMAIAQTKSKSK